MLRVEFVGPAGHAPLPPLEATASASVQWLKAQLAPVLGVSTAAVQLSLASGKVLDKEQNALRVSAPASGGPLVVHVALSASVSASWSQVASRAQSLKLKERPPAPVVQRAVPEAPPGRPRPSERVTLSELVAPAPVRVTVVPPRAPKPPADKGRVPSGKGVRRANPNPVDRTATIIERGKERLVPKKKK